jgi:NADPH:quinone reductase-like Zn-dependent oxidoreductase
MNTQRVAVFDMTETGTGFVIRTAAIPEPGPDEVRFKVAAFGLNQADLLLTQGRHYVQAELPIRVGYEGSGIVDAVGANVSRFQIGDNVTSIPNVDGPYYTGGEYALAKESFLSLTPAGWSAAQAASVWMQSLTPYFPFAELFPFQPGDWVMITGATGGTGLGFVRMAKLFGARVIATTRSESKVATLREHGADEVFSTESAEFVAEVMRVTEGKGVTLIADALGGHYVPVLSQTLASRGTMFIHGSLSGSNEAPLPLGDLLRRGACIAGYSLLNETRRDEALQRGREFIVKAIEAGSLPAPLVDRVFPFEDVAKAYEWMAGGKQTGKIVVTVAG